MENKVTFGLEKVHYATYTTTDGVVTYDAPVEIPGAVELTNEPRGDLIEFYADNMLYYSAQNNQGYESTLTISNIPDHFSQDVLGEVLDADDEVVNELATAQGKQFAFLFQFEGDKKAIRHVMYNCTANRPSVSSSTKTDSTEPNTNELSMVASPIEIDGKKMVKTKTTVDTSAAIYDAWYTSVYKKVVV